MREILTYGLKRVQGKQAHAEFYFINHHRPSISITGKNSLIVSWSADNGAGIGKITGSQLPDKEDVILEVINEQLRLKKKRLLLGSLFN